VAVVSSNAASVTEELDSKFFNIKLFIYLFFLAYKQHLFLAALQIVKFKIKALAIQVSGEGLLS
jgi:hypothetical protein